MRYCDASKLTIYALL